MAMRLIEKVIESRTVLFVETSSKIIIINKYKYEWKTSCNTATDYNETSFMQEVDYQYRFPLILLYSF